MHASNNESSAVVKRVERVLPDPHRDDNRVSKAQSFLNCPRCRLSLKPKAAWLSVEYCPRCIARSGIPVRLFPSALPAAELYHESALPSADHRPGRPVR